MTCPFSLAFLLYRVLHSKAMFGLVDKRQEVYPPKKQQMPGQSQTDGYTGHIAHISCNDQNCYNFFLPLALAVSLQRVIKTNQAQHL